MASASSTFTFAIAASFTAEPVASVIHFWSSPLQSSFACRFAPFNQLLQTLLDPASVFAANTHGLNVLWFRHEDLGEPARRDDNLRALLDAVAVRAPQLASPLLLIADIELPSTIDSVFTLSPARIDSWYPVINKLSGQGNTLGAIPYTADYFVAAGTAIVRAAHAILKAPHKVLALDCDNTLWRGICGEDGPDGISLEPGHRALQQFALAQRQAGMLLVTSSKNNEADVIETFARHPEFPLRFHDFTAHRINWLPKSAALSGLSSELSLGLDSFIFLDDNPKEVSELDEQLPQVLALTLPDDSSRFEHFLNHIWAFDRLRVTAADAARAASYEGVQEFGKALHAAGSLEQFHATLELDVTIRPIAAEEVPRAAQLTQRTNQFNFTTIRRTEAALQSLLAEGIEIFGVHVRDRFGDYGFTGLLIGRAFEGEYTVENLLLSCRVLGRGVEHRVISWLGHHAAAQQCSTVHIPFSATERNAPALEFHRTLPVPATAAALAAIEFVPRREAAPAPAAQAAPQQAAHSVDYAHIAAHLSSVAAIRRHMRRHKSVQLETPTETRLAAIWQDLLDAETVTGASNFFDLGGHSLKVVLLLMRVTEEFGVDLGIEDVYGSEVTLERMARRIDELAAFGGVGHEDYQRLLAEIESMTDDEALSALLEESGTHADPARR